MKIKVQNIRKHTYNKNEDLFTYYGDCGNCGRRLDVEYDNYCSCCGNKLDWSEIEELKEA